MAIPAVAIKGATISHFVDAYNFLASKGVLQHNPPDNGRPLTSTACPKSAKLRQLPHSLLI
jgi:hypothetical protein